MSLRVLYRRLLVAAFLLAALTLMGTAGYHHLGHGRWTYFECFYMTVITLSTVGFGETLPGMGQVEGARLVTLGLILAGSGLLVAFISTLTALIVEGDLQGLLRIRRMNKSLDQLNNHLIICGIGTTGRHIVRELESSGVPFVVIDTSKERLEEMAAQLPGRMLYVMGDATDDAIMQRAGVSRCRGVIAALSDDKSNLFVTISARALAPNARIVAKAVEATTERKLYRAGADGVVSPNYIGGMRLVNEMIRPATVEFLDRILQDRDGNQLRIEEVPLPQGSSLEGKTLAQSGIRNTGALVLAVHLPHGEYVYNPKGDQRLERGTGLVVLADSADLGKLRASMASNTLMPPPPAAI